MPDVAVFVKDERTVECPVPANAVQTTDFCNFIEQAHKDGYNLTAAQTRETGQRDPYVVGVRLTFTKSPHARS